MEYGSQRAAVTKGCPVCGARCACATRRCKTEGCGWNFTEKIIERAGMDGGAAVRATQERKRKQPDPPLSSTVTGSVTKYDGVDPEDDGNMDSCIICGDIGTLICCDLCPCSYHPDCAGLSAVPLGFWCCPQCVDKNLQAGDPAAAAAAAANGGDSSTGVSGVGGVGRSIQSGLDAFHQRLNACLDYTDTQLVEIEGNTFMCFRPPMDAATAAQQAAAKKGAGAANGSPQPAAAAAAVAAQ